jgi:hypothetical protein
MPDNEIPQSSLNDYIKKLIQERNRLAHGGRFPLEDRVEIKERIKNRKSDLENEELAQNIILRKKTLWILFIFLGIETFFIFVFTFLQATKIWDFRLEEWSFKLLVAATISQITYMLQFAVKHLFPNKK